MVFLYYKIFFEKEGFRLKRIVVKVGSSSLVDESGSLSRSKVMQLVRQLAVLHQSRYQLILVTSGAVAAGVGALRWNRMTLTMPEKQAAAAVGQSILVQQYQECFAHHSIPAAQLLLTRSDIEDRKRFIHIRNTIEPLLHHGIIPIINENDTVAVEEIRFGDNDTLGALVSLVSGADLYVMLSDIEGLYTANPKTDKNAKLLHRVESITPDIWKLAGDKGSSVGTGGMKTKLQAAQIATQSGVDVQIANSMDPDVLQRIIAGDTIGTHFIADTPLKKKKPWIAYGSRAEGSVIVDTGAYVALTEGHSSLLLAGIISTTGNFLEGSVVEIWHGDETIGKGIVHLSKRDIDQLISKRNEGEPLPLLPEVIHCDQLVLLSSKRSVPECSEC
jgi:glutamate 5-kinase